MNDKNDPEILDDTNNEYTIQDLCTISGRNIQWIDTLLEYEVIYFDISDDRFSHHQVNITLKALRLQSDLELNTAGVALALQLIEKIERQEKELKQLRHLAF